MSIISDLAHFYDAKAEHYSETRKKHRHELEYILQWINNSEKKELRIVELWCGDGRTIKELREKTDKKIIYIWVDISQWLLDIGKKHSPKDERVCKPMEEYVTTLEQESVDFFISFASFQHLPDESKRMLTLMNIYRALTYGGKHITFNRAFSKWFRQKMKIPVMKAYWKSIISFGRNDKYDIMVPWSDQDKMQTYYRYYHMFSLKELRYLSNKAGFIVKECSFIDSKWAISDKVDDARNSYVVQEKNISRELDYQI